VLEPSELDLQLAFVALSALREDLEDQLGAVDDRNVPAALQIALLDRRQLLIEDDERDAFGSQLRADLVGLARSDEQGGIRPGAAHGDAIARRKAGGVRKRGEFVEGLGLRR